MSAADMVARERYQEILNLLTPGELVVLALRLEYDLSYTEIGAELGISRQAAQARMDTAGRRLARAYPWMAYKSNNKYRDPVEHRRRELAFLRAVVAIEARGDMPTLPAVGRETDRGKWTNFRIWDRIRINGWARLGDQVGNSHPVELTPAGRAVLGVEHVQGGD